MSQVLGLALQGPQHELRGIRGLTQEAGEAAGNDG